MFREDIKFSLWCDFVERNFLKHEFVELIDKKIVNAATSNPAIFKAAILSSEAYQQDKVLLKGKSPKEIYETLAIQDISLAAKTLLASYERGDDGFISIEVDPFLCDDAEGTIEEGKRLFKAINYPNVMIKVPATEAGFIAMEALLAEGINVNATLIFSEEQTKKCVEAFARANVVLKQKGVQTLPKAVVSIFVSRFDRKLDDKLKALELPQSRVGVMNALKCYALIESYKIANVRALFASTGVKGDTLSPDYYIKELLVPNAINTAPLSTIHAFVSSSKESRIIEVRSDLIDNFFNALAANDIAMDTVCDELMQEGLSAFKEAFVEILDALK